MRKTIALVSFVLCGINSLSAAQRLQRLTPFVRRALMSTQASRSTIEELNNRKQHYRSNRDAVSFCDDKLDNAQRMVSYLRKLKNHNQSVHQLDNKAFAELREYRKCLHKFLHEVETDIDTFSRNK